MSPQSKPVILIIDDEPDRLAALERDVRALTSTLEVRTWAPEKSDGDPGATFAVKASGDVGFVVTDHDLTKNGPPGLLGTSIATWCLDRYLPMCYFTRRVEVRLPRERSIFEFRISFDADERERAREIVRLAHGFQDVRERLASGPAEGSMSDQLAGIFGRPILSNDLAPYFSGIGLAHSQILQDLASTDFAGEANTSARASIQAFVLGHILANAVLEFPGPILNTAQLNAYCGTDSKEYHRVSILFEKAAYVGPFSQFDGYFYRDRVDAVLDAMSGEIEGDDPDTYGRLVVEGQVGTLPPHECERIDCHGTRGGFWCPFTGRTVCGRQDCSVASTSWIPRGAVVCRVERDYFDEHAPLLGS